jgi:hypothetical protein
MNLIGVSSALCYPHFLSSLSSSTAEKDFRRKGTLYSVPNVHPPVRKTSTTFAAEVQ